MQTSIRTMEVSGRRRNGSGESKTGLCCDPCEWDGEKQLATNYCIQCNDFLCSTCSRNHRKSKSSRSHEVLDCTNMPNCKIGLSDGSVCGKHDGKPLEYYCHHRKDFYCSSCAVLEHRNCKLEYLACASKGFSDSREYNALTHRIRRIKEQIFESNQKVKSNADLVDANHQMFLYDLEVFYANVKSALDTIKEQTKESAKYHVDCDKYDLRHVEAESNEMDKDLEDITTKMDALCKYKQDKLLFISSKRASIKLDEYEVKLADLESMNTYTRYDFHHHDKIRNVLKTCQSFVRLQPTNR